MYHDGLGAKRVVYICKTAISDNYLKILGSDSLVIGILKEKNQINNQTTTYYSIRYSVMK